MEVGPLFMACCQDDDTFSPESRNKAVKVLAREKKDWQMQLFPKVGHGFACRGNMDVPYEREYNIIDRMTTISVANFESLTLHEQDM